MITLSSEKTAFPTFDQEQRNAIASIGDLVTFSSEQVLIEHGQKDYPFYVVKSGEVRIV